MRLAAVDIGTNSILLLVADRLHNKLVPLMDLAQTVRLGENLSATGRLSEDAIARTLTGLADYAEKLQPYAPDKVVCFGTAALRIASNAAEFCQQVKDQFGWDVRVLSGEDEALYTFRGVMSDLPADQTEAIAIDIGGGSTEVIAGTCNRILHQESFPVGAVVVKDRFHLGEQISPEQQRQVQTALRGQFTALPAFTDSTVLVTGGTATTLAALEQQLTSYDIQRIDGYCLGRDAIASLYDRLNALSLQDRAQLPGMEPGRADIILPALIILLTLLDQLKAESIQITVRGARYGLLLNSNNHSEIS